MCGEHSWCAAPGIRSSGSSPRVRGTLDVVGLPERCRRFIPACAGNTQLERLLMNTLTVHPRVCGEHLERAGELWINYGSSPRVRGTPMLVGLESSGRRFIPACAGNTYWESQRQSALTVHPRVCGEHVASAHQRPGSAGSSPRVRGTPFIDRRTDLTLRFIPACAGNTAHRRTASAASAVHPRVCGEHALTLNL